MASEDCIEMLRRAELMQVAFRDQIAAAAAEGRPYDNWTKYQWAEYAKLRRLVDELKALAA